MLQPTASSETAGRTRARVLVASGDRELRRELTKLMQPLDVEVATTHTAAGTLASAHEAPPDTVILDHGLPDMSGTELCRRLQRVPEVGFGTPILVTLPPDAGPEAQRDATRASAWSVLPRPIDPVEFSSRLRTYLDARRHQQRAASEGIVDPSTGLYNPRGVGRWARELTALAYRRRASLACLAISPIPADGTRASDEDSTVSHFVEVLRTVRRAGDVVGRLGRTEFVVLAPETNARGAIRYAERLARTVRSTGARPPALRVGYDAVDNAHDTPTDAIEMVGHASRALRWARSSAWGPWIRSFEPHETPPPSVQRSRRPIP